VIKVALAIWMLFVAAVIIGQCAMTPEEYTEYRCRLHCREVRWCWVKVMCGCSR
jgi:hypothetical protein